MNALISGSYKFCIIYENDIFKFYYGDNDNPKYISSLESENIFKFIPDKILIKNSTENDIINKFNQEKSRSVSLMLILSILDSAVDDIHKVELISCLDEVLNCNNDSYFYLLSVLFSRELPSNSIKKIPSVFKNTNSKSIEIINLLFENQIKIMSYFFDFEIILREYDISSHQKKYIEGFLVNNSFFYLISTSQLNEVEFINLISVMSNNLENIDIKNHDSFIDGFTKKFKKHLIF